MGSQGNPSLRAALGQQLSLAPSKPGQIIIKSRSVVPPPCHGIGVGMVLGKISGRIWGIWGAGLGFSAGVRHCLCCQPRISSVVGLRAEGCKRALALLCLFV